MNILGRFSKVAETKNCVIIGLLGSANMESLQNEYIIKIASFYGIKTAPDLFHFHELTAAGAKKRGCKLPLNNYNSFIEIFK